MIVENSYKCEVCGGRFSTEEKALECEGKHVAVKGIVRSICSPYKEYPSSLIVEMADGKTVQYRINPRSLKYSADVEE